MLWISHPGSTMVIFWPFKVPLHAMLANWVLIIKKDFFTKGASYHFDPPQGGIAF